MAKYTASVEKRFQSPGPQPNGLQAADDGLWVIELAREALASKPMRLEQSAQLSESGVNVQQLHRLPDHAAASLLLRCHEEQGHARTKVVVGEFAPKILFADVKAVIAVQADDCIAIQAESFQFTHHAAHLRIRE